ncbi:uncharacterized protein EAE98_010507 [Botrytis deweyae]|uniref:Uncharacterized protein n=1 Tax=Botrytis deweyae TaxID=2478750 RepID=A0ABQ7I8H6_9HELO|nr:uncharacterized protein EAE98_010507 [Botrytis deweyae]KAF7916785.1 hypothetical protein EAE98_010507 [Botrytis deweyae]
MHPNIKAKRQGTRDAQRKIYGHPGFKTFLFNPILGRGISSLDWKIPVTFPLHDPGIPNVLPAIKKSRRGSCRGKIPDGRGFSKDDDIDTSVLPRLLTKVDVVNIQIVEVEEVEEVEEV